MKPGKTRRCWCHCVLAGIVMKTCILTLGAAQASESPSRFETIATDTVSRETIDGGLSSTDESLYRRAFTLQRDGYWAEADILISRLNDDLLVGSLLAQRYLHPTRYVSSGEELCRWLEAYPDHPDAPTIHRLAKARSKDSTTVPDPDDARSLRGRGGIDGGDLWLRGLSLSRLSHSSAEMVKTLAQKFRRALRSGSTLTAKNLLTDTALPRLLTSTDTDRLRGALGFSYFLDGRDDLARTWAEPAARRSGDHAPQAAWTAGLANWRMKRFAEAEVFFGLVAKSRRTDPWMQAAGGFWAARAALHARHPQSVNDWLTLAADHGRTFYGLIARRTLGLPIGFGWDAETISRADRDTLAQFAGGRRALALLQIGEYEFAEAELRRLFPGVDPPTQQAVVAIADAGGLAALSIRLSAEMQRREGVIYDNARYPVPTWTPEGGWTIDRALVYAFARQESGFDPNAKSHVGARGLMQLMPATARFVSARARNHEILFDPTVNLAIGQRYLNHLLDESAVGNNLFFLAVAYNGGPGNLAAWSRKAKYGDDPLLFIESLASRETRHFIGRIMANLWIYRLRLNQNTPSLDAVVSGHWPVYTPLDRLEARLATRQHFP
ncbi:MAG: lytic transglycosylase domain-containing protein [Methylothermaceae bacterium]|nr:lytic transglycosylase domain-containing protein [Methylothermaceae bacterium]